MLLNFITPNSVNIRSAISYFFSNEGTSSTTWRRLSGLVIFPVMDIVPDKDTEISWGSVNKPLSPEDFGTI